MKSNKVITLLKEGFRFETLSKLSESQINTLYGKVITEQSITDAAKTAKEELANLGQTVDSIAKKIASEEDNIETNNALGDLAMQTDTGQETPHDEKDMAPDGMDDDSDNNRSTMGEEKEENNAWAICTSQLGKEFKTTKRSEWSAKQMNKYERCVRDVKQQNENHQKVVRQIEESLVSLIQKYVMTEKMTKKDILEADTKEAPVKTPVKTPTKPDRKSPYQPKHQPAPKAGDTKEAPVKTPVKTPTKPDRKSPYQPKYQPAPKAELPDFLKFKNLNIQFRDENED